MERTWEPTTAGILCIIAGAIGVVTGIVVAVFGGIIGTFFGIAWTGAFGVPSIILGIIAIVGGSYALRRRVWGLALAGSICALLGRFSGYSPLYSSAWGRANLSKVQGSASYMHQSSYPIYEVIVLGESGNYNILFEKL